MLYENKGSLERPPIDETGTWVMSLAQFSLGVDGVGLMIWLKDRQLAFIAIPLLLIWQSLVFVYFFRQFLPKYRSLAREHPEFCGAYKHLLRLATGMPIIVTIAAWATVSALSGGNH